MTYSERDIVYENGNHWVLRTDKGTFEVYSAGITHSIRRGIIGFTGEKGLRMAKEECDRREKLKEVHRA